jgi:hypothetical protein
MSQIEKKINRKSILKKLPRSGITKVFRFALFLLGRRRLPLGERGEGDSQ